MDTDYDDIRPIIISIICILNIILNVFLIAVFIRYPQLREDRTVLFVLSLTLSDLANGCTTMPISAAVCSDVTPNVRNMLRYLPKINELCFVWFCLNSIHSLCWVTVCKMVAITKPLRYEQVLTRSRCCLIIIGIWLSGAVYAAILCPWIVSWDLDTCLYYVRVESLPVQVVGLLIIGVIFGLVAPLAVIIYANIRIFVIIVRTHRQMAAQLHSIGGSVAYVGNIPSLTTRSIRSGRNVLILCLTYFFLTIPVGVSMIAAIVKGPNYKWSTAVKFSAVWSVYCNTFLNSLLYVFLFRNVRGKALKMLRDACKWWTLA